MQPTSIIEGFNESPTTKSILSYMADKYNIHTAIMSLIKACSIISAKTDQRLNFINCAPSRQYKSRTDKEIESFFPPTKKEPFLLNLGSDLTAHYLAKKFNGKLPTCCMVINDGTLLFETKEKRSMLRLCGMLAEILSEGKWTYGDNTQELKIEGQISMTMNFTIEHYTAIRNRMERMTFVNRFLILYFVLDIAQLNQIYLKREETFPMKYTGIRITAVRYRKKTHHKDQATIMELSTKYSLGQLCPLNSMMDNLEALAKSHAALNGREFIGPDDILLLNVISSYIKNPSIPDGNIAEAYHFRKTQGYNFDAAEIAKYNHCSPETVFKVIKKMKLRGLA